ncbi:hypothetical protein Ancab_018654 [Ancistrocladus abbreviatus]
MDVSEMDKSELDKRSEDCVNYRSADLQSNWQYNNANIISSSVGFIPNGNPMTVCKGDFVSPSGSSASMVDSFDPAVWPHPLNSQPLGMNGINLHNGATTSNPVGLNKGVLGPSRSGIEGGWSAPSSVLKGGLFLPNVSGMLPPSLSHFPTDSAFIERAARFSCFNAGNFGDMVNPFNIHQSVSPYLRGGMVMQGPQDVFSANAMQAVAGGQEQGDEANMAKPSTDISLLANHGPMEGSPLKNEGRCERSHDEAKQAVSLTGNESDEAGFSGGGGGGQEEPSLMDTSGEPSAKGLGSKKRKRGSQGVEPEHANGVQQQPGEALRANNEIQQKEDQNLASTNNKTAVKQGKQTSEASDLPKEEYIHVRARRGQATNSHSLAERVRREKISERMKFLQDLVPGCSKVTGKAVMLDEIINYVQSLQRQVEFLSMKLATVNPRLDFNIEGLLAKDMLLSRTGPSSTLGFSADVPISYPHLHPSQQPIMQPGLPPIGNSTDALGRTITSQLTSMSSGFKEPTPMLPNVWEDELHNVVHMGFSTSAPLDSQGSLPPGNMKVEL